MKRVISDEILNTKTACNLLIYTLYSKFLANQACNPTEEELAGYKQCIVLFQSVINYIGKHQSTKNRFIFSTIEKESIGSSFYGRNLSLSQQHRYNSYISISNMSQNSVTSFDSQEKSLVNVDSSRDIIPKSSSDFENNSKKDILIPLLYQRFHQ